MNKLKKPPICDTCHDTGIISWPGHPTVSCGYCEIGDNFKETHQPPERYGKVKSTWDVKALLIIGFFILLAVWKIYP